MSLYDSATAQFLGNITRDLEVKTFASGFSVGETTIAVNRSVKKGDEWKSETSFLPVKVLGKTAEALEDHAKKGMKAYATGELQEERWETKEGQKRSRIVLVANKLVIVGGPRKGKDSPGKSEAPQASQEELEAEVIPF